jgi:hypothetical protein
MTSWAVVADVWFLPKQEIQENETPEQFAERVQSLVADKAHLLKGGEAWLYCVDVNSTWGLTTFIQSLCFLNYPLS